MKGTILSGIARIICLGLVLVSLNGYAYIRYEVKRGDTLWGLAHKYGLSPDQIIEANPQAQQGLKTGETILIPEEQDLNGTAVKAPETPAKEAEQPNVSPVKEPIVEYEEEDDIEGTLPENVTAPQRDLPPTDFDNTQNINPLETPVIINQDIPQAEEAPKAGGPEGIRFARLGDTLDGIATDSGIPVNDLLKYNPLLDRYNIPQGYAVRLSADAPYLPHSTYLTVVDSIVFKVIPEHTVIKSGKGEKTVAVLLPFDVESEVIGRQSLYATDFYKGFLIAVQKATKKRDYPLKVIAVDTQCDSVQLAGRLATLIDEDVTVIIPPDDDKQLRQIEQFALDNDIMVVNVLNVKDDSYQTYPNVIQCNISQKLMYDKAINMLMNDMKGYTPVILDLSGGKDEKSSFVDELRQKYESEGRNVINLSFKNHLEASDLATLPKGKKYVFIPKSGTADVFNKISETLQTAINENYVDETYRVFGYPDWITFRGEQEEALHTMGATIYSRFYLDANDFNTMDVNEEYIKWYGTEMEEVFPSQGLLGYDAANLVLKALKKTWTDSDFEKFERGTYEGVQSTFHFIRDDESNQENAGLINDALYIIEYLPGQALYVKTI